MSITMRRKAKTIEQMNMHNSEGARKPFYPIDFDLYREMLRDHVMRHRHKWACLVKNENLNRICGD